jgi:hypothetical protein
MERDILKKSDGHLQQPPEVRYELMQKHRSEFPVEKMAKTLKVSRSGFYAWQRRGQSRRGRAFTGAWIET